MSTEEISESHNPFAGMDVGKVVEESAMVGQSYSKESATSSTPGVLRLVQWKCSPAVRQCKSPRAKTRGRDPGHHGIVGGRLGDLHWRQAGGAEREPGC